MLIAGSLIFLMFLLLCLVAAVCLVAVVIKSRRRPQPSLVNPMVRRALNDDLDRVTTKAEVNRVKRQWFEDDGWELNE